MVTINWKENPKAKVELTINKISPPQIACLWLLSKVNQFPDLSLECKNTYKYIPYSQYQSNNQH